jgi:hypothetical protein
MLLVDLGKRVEMGFSIVFCAKSKQERSENESDHPFFFWCENEAIAQILKSCAPTPFQLFGRSFARDRTRSEQYFRFMFRS